jgi:hypothetical protein
MAMAVNQWRGKNPVLMFQGLTAGEIFDNFPVVPNRFYTVTRKDKCAISNYARTCQVVNV